MGHHWSFSTLVVLALAAAVALAAGAPALGAGAGESPVAYSDESVDEGRVLYLRHCADCHGRDGRAQIDLIADATDLTTPGLYRSGAEPAEIYRSISEGAGIDMPPFASQFEEEEIWHMVNFILSLWPAEERARVSGDSD